MNVTFRFNSIPNIYISYSIIASYLFIRNGVEDGLYFLKKRIYLVPIFISYIRFTAHIATVIWRNDKKDYLRVFHFYRNRMRGCQ